MIFHSSSEIRAVFLLAASAAIPIVAFGQAPDSLDVTAKLSFHVHSTIDPAAIAGDGLYAGVLQLMDSPREWGQGAEGYGKRFGSAMAFSGVHSALAFGLDSTLHQDPRYFRLGGSGFLRRARHALRGTLLTRTDSGGETLSTWRIGSAYGSAFISNMWYPDRVNTVRLGFLQGTETLGWGFARNLGSEFWPDIKRKIFSRK